MNKYDQKRLVNYIDDDLNDAVDVEGGNVAVEDVDETGEEESLIVEEENEMEAGEVESNSELEYSVEETGSEKEDAEASVDYNAAAAPFKGVQSRPTARVEEEEMPAKVPAKSGQNNDAKPIDPKRGVPQEMPKAAPTKSTIPKDALKIITKVMPKLSKQPKMAPQMPNGSSAAAEAGATNGNKAQKRPTTNKMVEKAIQSLNERSGSSLIAIRKYILSNFPDLEESRITFFIKKSLKSMTSKGLLVQTKGVGANGSFKLSTKVAKDKVEENKLKQRELKAKELAKAKQKALQQKVKALKLKATTVKKAIKVGKMANIMPDEMIPSTSKAIATKPAKDKKARKAEAAETALKALKAPKTTAAKVPTVKKTGKSVVKQPAARPNSGKMTTEPKIAAVATKQQNAKKPMAVGGANGTAGAAGKAPTKAMTSKKLSAPAKGRPKKNA